jgi:hypothetical protein
VESRDALVVAVNAIIANDFFEIFCRLPFDVIFVK